jgi:hypothetical protein
MSKRYKKFLCACGGVTQYDFAATLQGQKQVTAGGAWPQHSYALGVQPNQVKEARDHSLKIGVPTEFDKAGDPILTSPEHYKRYAEGCGFYTRNGFGGRGEARKQVRIES